MIYDGWVYLAKSDTGHYKIGRSRNPFGRIKHFDTIMPVEVDTVALIPCTDYVTAEKCLHDSYAHCREKGEWFSLTDKQVEDIQAIVCYVGDDFVRSYPVYADIRGREHPVRTCCIDYREALVSIGIMDYTMTWDDDAIPQYAELPY